MPGRFSNAGGKDVATLGSVTNTVANVANMATPAVGIVMMRLFNGSAIGLLGLSAFLKVAAGIWLAKEMSTVDGRTLLKQRNAAKQK